MNWLVFHIVSGQSFFTGIMLLVFAVITARATRPVYKRFTVLAFLAGVIAVAISSTPIPYWLYAVASMVTTIWIISVFKKRWGDWAPHAMIAIWLLAGLFELPYHIVPSLDISGDRSVCILGDSVTAGVGGDEKSETWPEIMGRQHELLVQDISHVGETAASAMKRAKSQVISARVVVIEIGGNDILGSTTARQFENDLDDLLGYLSVENRQLIMFELPLPPFCNEYGRVQRAVAAKHNVKLVPKRVFLSVIANRDSTLDTVHLTQRGHSLMAMRVWGLIQSAFEDAKR